MSGPQVPLRDRYSCSSRALRERLVGRGAEVSRSDLSQLEKGTFYASLKILEKLARVLDVEPAELLRSPQRRKKLDR